jgi:hypothetical protein
MRIIGPDKRYKMDKQWRTTTAREGGITTAVVEELPETETRKEIAALAHQFWQARGCPNGTPEEDWFRAEQEISKSKGARQRAS